MMESKLNRMAVTKPDAQFRVLGEAEAAARLSLGRRTLQDMRLSGGGPPFIRLGERRVGYLLSDLELWVAARRAASTSAETVAA